MLKIAPSILSADFSYLKAEVEAVLAGGADWIHVDVMDGMFVPNISMGFPVLQALRHITGAFLDVHLMIDHPERYVKRFCDAGADMLTLHIESAHPENLIDAVRTIRNEGKSAGLAVKPRTPAEILLPFLGQIDMVLVMTVEPGFGGQSFMEDQLTKIGRIREMLGPDRDLEVDGGIDINTAPLVSQAGANVLVAGSSVFGCVDRRFAISAIKDACM